jgi:RNA polymerase sigma-70 factor (ECF subfamily)
MLSSIEIAKIYDENFEKIYRFFYYKFLSKDIAEDLTSDTFMNFIDNAKQKPDSIQDPTKYLFGIAKHVYLIHLKKKYNQLPTVEITSEQEFGAIVDDFIDEIDDSPTIEDIAMKFIILLPDKQKEVAILRFIEKLSLTEICTKMKKDMNYVKTTQKRAMKSLKEIVARENFI